MEEEAQAPEETIEAVEEVATLETEEAVEAETQEDAPETQAESTTETTAEDNKSGYERRQKYKAKKDEADKLKLENEHLREQMRINMHNAQPQPPVQKLQGDPNAPKIGDFEEVEDYMEADYNYRDAKKQVQLKQETQLQGFTELEKVYAANNKTYLDDVSYSNVKPTPIIAQEILRSKRGPELIHAFSKDPDLARRLNSLHPSDAIRELIKLEEKVKVTPAVSSAPAPISTPKTSVSKGSNKFSGEMSQADYNKQMADYRKSKYG